MEQSTRDNFVHSISVTAPVQSFRLGKWGPRPLPGLRKRTDYIPKRCITWVKLFQSVSGEGE